MIFVRVWSGNSLDLWHSLCTHTLGTVWLRGKQYHKHENESVRETKRQQLSHLHKHRRWYSVSTLTMRCVVYTIPTHAYVCICDGMCTENFQSLVHDLISTERNLWLMIALELIRRSTRFLSHSSATERCVMLIGCMYVYKYSTRRYVYFMAWYTYEGYMLLFFSIIAHGGCVWKAYRSENGSVSCVHTDSAAVPTAAAAAAIATATARPSTHRSFRRCSTSQISLLCILFCARCVCCVLYPILYSFCCYFAVGYNRVVLFDFISVFIQSSL